MNKYYVTIFFRHTLSDQFSMQNLQLYFTIFFSIRNATKVIKHFHVNYYCTVKKTNISLHIFIVLASHRSANV